MFTYSLQSVILDFSSQSYRSRNGCLEWIWIGSTYGSNAKGSPACVLRTPGVSMFLFAACLNTLMICFYSIAVIRYCHFHFILLLSRTLFDIFSKFSSIFHLTSIWVKWMFIWYSHRLNLFSNPHYPHCSTSNCCVRTMFNSPDGLTTMNLGITSESQW